MYIITDSTTNHVLNIAHAPSEIDGFMPPSGQTAYFLDDSKASVIPSNWSDYTYINGTFTQIPPTLDEAKAAQSAIIEQSYAQTMDTGFTSSVDGASRTYPADEGTLGELAWARGIPSTTYPPSGIIVIASDGTHINMTQTQIEQLINDAQAFYIPNRNKRLSLLKQIADATTVSAVQAVTW